MRPSPSLRIAIVSTLQGRSISSAPGWKPAAPRKPHKLVLLVRGDLKMGTGKVAAQCAHAFVQLCGPPPKYEAIRRDRAEWKDQGSVTVPLRVPDVRSMHDIADAAIKRGLATVIIRDDGRTQVHRGSETVLAIGPCESGLVDDLCGEHAMRRQGRGVPQTSRGVLAHQEGPHIYCLATDHLPPL